MPQSPASLVGILVGTIRLSQGLYWLSSVADKVFVNPEGAVEWKGLASQVMFYKNLIDRLGLDVQIIRHGTYKSAVEPYITTEMSRANRIQTGALVGSIWGTLVEDVPLLATFRSMPTTSAPTILQP